MSTSIKIPISFVIHIVRFTVPLLSCWLERALESAAPPLHFPVLVQGGAAQERGAPALLPELARAAWPCSPAPAGGNKGGSARGKRRSSLAVLCLAGEVCAAVGRGRRPESRGGRPSAWGISCARSASYCAGAAGAGPRAPRRGAVRRGAAGRAPLVQLLLAGGSPEAGAVGTLGGEHEASEALAGCFRAGRGAVVSWRGPCDGARRKEAP